MGLITVETVEIYSDKILILRLNNPVTKNSLSWEMGEAFHQEIETIKRRPEPPRCVVITGEGSVFSSGGDLKLLKSFKEKSLEQNKKDMLKFYNFFLGVRSLPCPVIAAVNGHAIGAALSLAFACDLRIFSEEGKYSFNFVKIGIHPGMGSSYLTKELFGTNLATRLLYLGETLTGREAHRLGLCHDALPTNEVLKRAMELAIEVSENSPLAIRELKKNLYNHEALQEALLKEAESQAKNFQSMDFAEALTAIEQKRTAVFKGI
jgi:2-(1,2-epoxy-1,2-dihydrophenyl)acetyl-CoA isomerase